MTTSGVASSMTGGCRVGGRTEPGAAGLAAGTRACGRQAARKFRPERLAYIVCRGGTGQLPALPLVRAGR
jgi:hypothetical protein